MFAKERYIGSQTLRTAKMACLRCIFSINEFDSYPFPFCFVNGIFNNSTSYPVTNHSVILSGIFAFNGMQSLEILHRYHRIIFLSNFNNSFADIMSNPIVYSSYTLPQPLNPFTRPLTFWQHRFKLINAMPNGGKLEIKTFADDCNVVVEISDTGIGLSLIHI